MRSNRRGVLGAIAAILGCMSTLAATSGTRALEELWPHPPGANWSYDRIELQWGAVAKSTATTVRFTLGDATVVGGSIAVQPLTVDVSGAAAEAGATFWRQLAIARPDCGSQVGGPSSAETSSGLVVHDAGLLRIAADEIAAYRVTPPIRSWLYSEPDVTSGHAFRLQLIPDLADSVFLDGSVVGSADLSTPAGSFAAALRIRYTVDWGWADATDSLGTVVGRVRGRTRGEMFYAPGVGPVLARETFVPQADVQGSPPPTSIDSTFAELRLLAHSPGPSGVRALSWTAMKAIYH